MSNPSIHQQTVAKLARARAQVTSLRQTVSRLLDAPQPLSKAYAREVQARVAHAEVLLSRADASVQRTRLAGRVPAQPAVAVPKSVRARAALAVLVAADGRDARGLRPTTIVGGKRPREDSADAAAYPRSVAVKVEQSSGGPSGTRAAKRGAAGGSRGAAAGGESSLGSAVGDASSSGGAESAPPTNSASDSNSVRSAVLLEQNLDALITLARESTGLDIIDCGNGAVTFKCPSVFSATLWLSTKPPEQVVDANQGPPDPDIPLEVWSKQIAARADQKGCLFPDSAAVCSPSEGIPGRWNISKFSVFQVVSERARAAARFYWAQHSCVGQAFLEFSEWLAAHKNLFSVVSESRRLAFDASRGIYLPPCIRPFRVPSDARFPRGSIPVNQGPSNTGMGVSNPPAMSLRQVSAAQQHRQRSQQSFGQAMANRQQLQRQALSQQQQQLLQERYQQAQQVQRGQQAQKHEPQLGQMQRRLSGQQVTQGSQPSLHAPNQMGTFPDGHQHHPKSKHASQAQQLPQFQQSQAQVDHVQRQLLTQQPLSQSQIQAQARGQPQSSQPQGRTRDSQSQGSSAQQAHPLMQTHLQGQSRGPMLSDLTQSQHHSLPHGQSQVQSQSQSQEGQRLSHLQHSLQTQSQGIPQSNIHSQLQSHMNTQSQQQLSALHGHQMTDQQKQTQSLQQGLSQPHSPSRSQSYSQSQSLSSQFPDMGPAHIQQQSGTAHFDSVQRQLQTQSQPQTQSQQQQQQLQQQLQQMQQHRQLQPSQIQRLQQIQLQQNQQRELQLLLHQQQLQHSSQQGYPGSVPVPNPSQRQQQNGQQGSNHSQQTSQVDRFR